MLTINIPDILTSRIHDIAKSFCQTAEKFIIETLQDRIDHASAYSETEYFARSVTNFRRLLKICSKIGKERSPLVRKEVCPGKKGVLFNQAPFQFNRKGVWLAATRFRSIKIPLLFNKTSSQANKTSSLLNKIRFQANKTSLRINSTRFWMDTTSFPVNTTRFESNKNFSVNIYE